MVDWIFVEFIYVAGGLYIQLVKHTWEKYSHWENERMSSYVGWVTKTPHILLYVHLTARLIGYLPGEQKIRYQIPVEGWLVLGKCDLPLTHKTFFTISAIFNDVSGYTRWWSASSYTSISPFEVWFHSSWKWRFGLWLPLYSCQSVPTGRALQSSQELATSRGTVHLAD